MDMTHPIRSIVPTLDGPVLEVLAGTTRPLTGLDIHRIADTGSPSGVRLVLGRLVEQGVVHADERAKAIFYTANREHLAWPAVEMLAGLRRALLDRLTVELESWRSEPIHASLFGSTARGAGDVHADVDVLLVRPDGTAEEASPWADQVDRLRQSVYAWTGNSCQAFQVDLSRLAEHVAAGDPLVDEWLRDSVTLTGQDLWVILRGLPTVGADQ